MSKVASLKSFQFKKQGDILNLESSTQFTDSFEMINSRPIFESPEKIKENQGLKPSFEKVISRTSSVTLLKQPQVLVQFEFLGQNLTLNVSEKDETSRTLQKWLQCCELSQQKKVKIRLIVYEVLFKRNIDFHELLESSLSQYADIQIKQIQEEQIQFHKDFE